MRRPGDPAVSGQPFGRQSCGAGSSGSRADASAPHPRSRDDDHETPGHPASPPTRASHRGGRSGQPVPAAGLSWAIGPDSLAIPSCQGMNGFRFRHAQHRDGEQHAYDQARHGYQGRHRLRRRDPGGTGPSCGWSSSRPVVDSRVANPRPRAGRQIGSSSAAMPSGSLAVGCDRDLADHRDVPDLSPDGGDPAAGGPTLCPWKIYARAHAGSVGGYVVRRPTMRGDGR